MTFIQGQKSIKDIKDSKSELISKAIFKDTMSLYLCKKTEKLCTALHLITRHISDGEPIKSKLRHLSLDVLSYVIFFFGGFSKNGANLGRDSTIKIYEILSCLEILRLSGFVSERNAEMLEEECRLLMAAIIEKREQAAFVQIPTPEYEINPQLFNVPIKPSVGAVGAEDHVTRNVGVEKVRGAFPERASSQNMERRGLIIELLRKKGGPITVRDILEIEPGLGTKTIQRELNSMINDGLLKRDGTRRWSTYNLTALTP